MNESELQSAVMQLAALYNWRQYHALPAMNQRGQWRTAMSGDKGFPDLVLACRYKIAFIELKSVKGRLTPDQQTWLDTLSASGTVDVMVWRPDDWTDGTIEEYLKWGK